MKKTMKILTAILLIAIIACMVNNVFAASTIIGDLDSAVNSAIVDTSSITSTVGKVIKMIRNISIVLGVLIIVILGFKYMMGSLEEKADYKKNFISLVIGIIVIMGATSIASFLFSIF